MKTIAYLDCPTGIAGDMCLAALVDAGVPLDYLQAQLARLGLNDEFTLSVAPVLRQGLRALQAQVVVKANLDHPVEPSPGHPPEHHDHDHHPGDGQHQHSHAVHPTRNLPAIEHLITQANLPDRVQHWSLAVFRNLARAEAAVHGIAIDQVHFHEVGATDAIIDIVGTCLGFDYLNIDTLVCSPLPTGRGRVKAAHGWLPVPAPAVLKLLEQHQVPLYSNGLDGELITPTGAAIATTLAQRFGDPPAMTLHRTGLGAGGKALPVANVLRLWIGVTDSDSVSAQASPPPKMLSQALTWEKQSPTERPDQALEEIPYDLDTVILLETQVDDLVPQAVGYLYDRLFSASALDVFTQPVAMKKSRPGLLITVICRPSDEPQCADILFSETSTLGIRRRLQQRWVLPRQIKTLQTPYGPINLKVACHPQTQAILNAHPEYEDCAALARRHGVSWQVVYHTALSTWYSHEPQSALPLPD
ncbi:nickel pincer cofactor biosynthesis protein LarC [filamentous cyanobacterium CCT1]|nr:nickel pincer cofactor biosynthesis protein LarC [filamentous cyanobacterium CCT1]PSN79975.1 nickel pincer cofactor biosynthesis protein LarC [filamentous cyanobacterium CCP4]